jgi:hypothetical protein
MWSPADVAAALGVTPASVRERCREGDRCLLDLGACGAAHVHAKRWGASWLIPRAELRRLTGEDGRPGHEDVNCGHGETISEVLKLAIEIQERQARMTSLLADLTGDING